MLVLFSLLWLSWSATPEIRLKVMQSSNGSQNYVSWKYTKSIFSSVVPFHRFWYDEEDLVHGVPYAVIDQVPFREHIPPNTFTGLQNKPVCPCGSLFPPPVAAPPLVICIVRNKLSQLLLQRLGSSAPFKHITLDQPRSSSHYVVAVENKCRAVLHVVRRLEPRDPVLEKCRPVPHIKLSSSWVNQTLHAASGPNIPLSSSFSADQLDSVLASLQKLLPDVWDERKGLEAKMLVLVARRLQECYEPSAWLPLMQQVAELLADPSATEQVTQILQNMPRRPVRALWLSIGSLARKELQRDQMRLLQGQQSGLPYDAKAFVAGWAATEDVYPCLKENHCNYTTTDHQYKLYMPRTGMPNAPTGWKCAQTRTLRSLVHVLALFEMDFIFILDDDTFVSKYLFFHPKFDQLMEKYVVHSNVVLGSLQLADYDVTRNGFYWGGSGLLFGRAVLDRLRSNVIPGPVRRSSSWSGTNMTRELSLYYEAMHNSQLLCPSCMTWNQSAESSMYGLGQTATTTVSLAEVCLHLLSHPNTCYHSDHALSRCLAHGTYSKFLDAPCTGKKFGDWFGMCYPFKICK